MARRAVFVRVGWMGFHGASEVEEYPVGGGAWNDHDVGGEFDNF